MIEAIRQAMNQEPEKYEPRKQLFFERCMSLPDDYLHCNSISKLEDPKDTQLCATQFDPKVAKMLLLTLVGTDPAPAPPPEQP